MFSSREDAADDKSLGRKGEDIACRALKSDKYHIVDKNFRCRQWEIDIIAEDKKGVLCFVEVKARSRDDFGFPSEAVTHHKQSRLLAAAFVYLQKNNIKSRAMRFDVVSVDLNRGESRIIKNALEADI